MPLPDVVNVPPDTVALKLRFEEETDGETINDNSPIEATTAIMVPFTVVLVADVVTDTVFTKTLNPELEDAAAENAEINASLIM